MVLAAGSETDHHPEQSGQIVVCQSQYVEASAAFCQSQNLTPVATLARALLAVGRLPARVADKARALFAVKVIGHDTFPR